MTKHLVTATIIAAIIALSSAITYAAPDCGPVARLKIDFSRAGWGCAVHAFDLHIMIER